MPGNPITDPNWAANLANSVDKYVGLVRDRATLKVVVVVRALVFGILIAISAVVALVLLVIVSTKLLQRIVDIGGAIDRDSAVWVSYLVMGGLCTLVGAVAMRMRAPKADAEPGK
jgi:hypothetical protein